MPVRGARHADGEGAGRSIPSSKPGVLFLFRTTLGTGLARTGTNTGTSREPPCKILLRGKNRHVPSWTSTSLVKFFSSDLVTKVKKVPVSGEDRREISKDRRSSGPARGPPEAPCAAPQCGNGAPALRVAQSTDFPIKYG